MANMVKRIGIMTSGGDAPAMNAAVRAVVRHRRMARALSAWASAGAGMGSSTATFFHGQ